MGEATIPAWLSKWRATVKPGCCPACGKPLPPKARGRPAWVHPARLNPDCRREYLRRYWAAHVGTSLRPILWVRFPKRRPGWARVKLDCGCIQDLQAHIIRRTQRRRCPNHP